MEKKLLKKMKWGVEKWKNERRDEGKWRSLEEDGDERKR